MPARDGTGSVGRGLGRMGGRGAGTGGSCVCPKCGATSSHARGSPCVSISCSKCGTKMV